MNEKYRLDSAENKAFMKEVYEGLLKFGRKFPAPTGSAYYLGDDGTPWTDRPRETYITCRMAHVYSMAAMQGVDGAAELADAALRGIAGDLRDKTNGGWYPAVNADGTAVPDKLCYAHAFVILAGTSGVLAGRPGAKQLLEEAMADYDRFFWNEKEGLSCDVWNTEFTVCDPYRGLNANMHTVEAFLAVADAIGREDYRVRAGRIIDRVIDWASNNNWRIPEHYGSDWTADVDFHKECPDHPFKPFGATPGHGLEWSRLITQWAMSTFHGDKTAAARYLDAAEHLFGTAVADAWNADGAPGIAYTTDWDGKPIVHDRMHWTLAEAINTAAVLYRVTGKQIYADRYAQFVQYMDEKVLDHVHGSWYHQLDQNNEVMTTVWPGKPDLYHAVQSTLIPYHDVSLSIAAAVKKNG